MTRAPRRRRRRRQARTGEEVLPAAVLEGVALGEPDAAHGEEEPLVGERLEDGGAEAAGQELLLDRHDGAVAGEERGASAGASSGFTRKRSTTPG